MNEVLEFGCLLAAFALWFGRFQLVAVEDAVSDDALVLDQVLDGGELVLCVVFVVIKLKVLLDLLRILTLRVNRLVTRLAR